MRLRTVLEDLEILKKRVEALEEIKNQAWFKSVKKRELYNMSKTDTLVQSMLVNGIIERTVDEDALVCTYKCEFKGKKLVIRKRFFTPSRDKVDFTAKLDDIDCYNPEDLFVLADMLYDLKVNQKD